MKNYAMLAVMCVLCTVAMIAAWSSSKKTTKAQPAPCVAAANEQCPSADWLKDYEEWKALNDKIEGSLKKDKDLRTGWASRLNDTMPAGYYFNVDTHKFQKRELPQPAAPSKAK